MCVGKRCPARQVKGQIRDEPVIGVEEPQRRRLLARRLAHDAGDDVVVVGDLLLAGTGARSFFGQRLEMRLHGVDLRHRLADRTLDLLRDLVRVVERQIARQLDVERQLGAAADCEDAHVVHLTDAPHS